MLFLSRSLNVIFLWNCKIKIKKAKGYIWATAFFWKQLKFSVLCTAVLEDLESIFKAQNPLKVWGWNNLHLQRQKSDYFGVGWDRKYSENN